MAGEQNVLTIEKEDKDLVKAVSNLTPEKMILVKGILIGIGLLDDIAPIKTDQIGTCRGGVN